MTAASVIVPARDAAATLPRTLEGLARQAGAFEVIVVDDGSRDSTAGIAREAAVVSRVIAKAPEGPGAARNAGAAAASGDVLAFLDADCVPVPGWLGAGLRSVEAADLVLGRVEADPAAPRGPWDRTLWVTRGGGLFQSANLFVRRELFERLGGFEDWLAGPAVRFGPATVPAKPLGEDVLFGWRAVRAGARTGFAPDALAHHAVFPRGPWEYVAERGRLRNFPHMVRRVPELRGAFLYRRLFLTRRSAAFDAALAGILLAAGTRRPGALAAALPYAAELRRQARRSPQASAPEVVAVGALADAVGLWALLRGTAEARTPVL